MPKILEEIHYDGAQERVERLGLTPIMDELKVLLTDFVLNVKEVRDANGGAEVRKRLDARFGGAPGWSRKISGDIDWVKCHTVNGPTVCLGVEIQVSARSDLLVVDMIHLNSAFREGRIDVGVIVVPTDRLGIFLTDRGPCVSDAKKHAQAARLEDAPLILLAIEHDGPGPALPKQRKRQSK